MKATQRAPYAFKVALKGFYKTVARSCLQSSKPLLVLVFLLFGTQLASQASMPPREASTDACPMSTASEWQAFLEKSASRRGWVETCEDSSCDPRFRRKVQLEVQDVLARCQTRINQNTQLRLCTERLRNFLPTWFRQHDDTSYGFNVDNHAYLTNQEADDRPEGMMRIPPEIVGALPDQHKVQEAARQNGWKFLTHDSALAGVRTFVVIQDPAGRFDQWMLLNLKKSSDRTIASKVALNMPVSLLSVQKKTRSGTPLDRVQLHFRDYSMAEIECKIKLEVNETGNGKCYSCHSNGMRQLISARTPTLEALPVRGEPLFGEQPPKEFAYWRLVEFNKLIRHYGTNDWYGMINKVDELGPMLGPRFNCVACHNGQSRAPITVFTSPAQLRKKLVDELSMPPDPQAASWLERVTTKNPQLSAQEAEQLVAAKNYHKTLFRDFMATRSPALHDWLLERSCF